MSKQGLPSDHTMLKPLGTLINTTYPPNLASTDSRYSIVRYRVIDYKLGINPYTRKTELFEQLECLSIEKKMPKSVKIQPNLVWKYI